MAKKKSNKDSGNDEDKKLKDEVGPIDNKQSKEGNEQKAEEQKKKEEEDMMKKLQEEVDRLSTKDIVIQMMMSLSSHAYKKMGLPVGTNDKFKDKNQAKLAVDSFDALLKAVKGDVTVKEEENLKSSLSNLQINFVKIFQ